MEIKNILHMVSGDGETSYANNSSFQKVVLSKTWPVLDETFKHMFNENNNGFPKCIRLADLGCSSGPNTLFFISHVIDTIQHLCKKDDLSDLPQLEVLLNDLPHNDFNNLFKLVNDFSKTNDEEKKLQCFIYGAPGSFYEPLFPSNSIHFVYSSFSMHWLSQVPERLGNKNKEYIHAAANSSPQVCQAYANQFQRDFSKFLSMRAEEVTSGGRMVLAFLGSPSSKDDQLDIIMLMESLTDMVGQGLIKKDDLYTFNLPIYMPCLQEIEKIVSDETSFNLDSMEAVSIPWAANEDYSDTTQIAELVASSVRAVMEPMLVVHFGCSVVDGVFEIYGRKMAEHLSQEKSSHFILVISLTRKVR